MAFDYSFPVFIQNDGVHTSGAANICLGNLSRATSSYRVDVYLTQPVGSNIDSLTPLQKQLFGDQIKISKFQRFESQFGVTLANVTELAKQQPNPCFSTNVP
jgi:hypothetical protein